MSSFTNVRDGISGMVLDMDHLDQGSGFSASRQKDKHLAELKKQLNAEFKVFRFHNDLNKKRIANMGKKASALEELGAISAVDAAAVQATSVAAVLEIESSEVKTESAMAQLNDNMFASFNKLIDQTEKSVRQGLGKTLDVDRAASALAKSRHAVLDAKIGDTRRRIAEFTSQINSSPNSASVTQWKLQRTALEQSKLAAESDLAIAQATVTKTALAQTSSEAAFARTTVRSTAARMETLTKAYIVDIEATWNGMKVFSESIHQAGTVMTKGYGAYYKQFAQGAELDSVYWTRALGFTNHAAAQESRVYQKSIAELSALTEGSEAYMVAMAKFATPSSRMMIMTQASFQELREAKYAYEFMRYIDPRWMAFAAKTAVRAPVGVALRGAEALIGREAVSGLAIGFKALGAVAGGTLEFVASAPVQIALFAIEVGYDLAKDGMTWQFADDVLGIVGLSLETFGLIGQKMQEYGEIATILKGKKEEPPQLRLMQYDSEELAMVVDFWGAEYIRLQEEIGLVHAPYQKLKPFRAILKVPGRYIDLANHPYETAHEIQDNLRIEALVSAGAFPGTDFSGRSQVEAWFPKKDGFVRNLRSFPLYDATFQWPDPHRGLPVQLDGNFSIHDIDPTIVDAFKKWAEDGTFGPVYNTSASPEARESAARANRLDLDQWLHPQSNWPTAWNEISVWVDGLRGKKAIMYSDMILLAPQEWLKEWNVDKSSEDWTVMWGYESRHPFKKYMSKQAYEDVKHKTGRYTYHPMDRVFLENVVNAGQIVDTGDYVWPFMPIPSKALESFSKRSILEGLIIPDHGVYSYYRAATEDEIEYYRDILNAGHEWKAQIDKKKVESEEEWQQDVLAKVWKEYLRAEQPLRTTWGYIMRYKQFFLEQLMYTCGRMAGDNRDRIMDEYKKIVSGSHIPLHTNSEHRLAFMGMFAKLAYSDSDESGQKFIKDITAKFGKILSNDLVTTDKNWKSMTGVSNLTNTILQEDKGLDIPIMFGSLNARMFVLDKPRVVVIAIKGTNSVAEWLINLDFTTGSFASIDHDSSDRENMVDIVSEPDGSSKSVGELTSSNELMTVHRGFLRAARALQPGIKKTLERYYKEFEGIQDVFIAGHSLGAAITQLMTMMIPRLPVTGKTTFGRPKTTYRNPHAYMFASPKVGDKRFQEQFSVWSGETVQVWINGDGITAVPPFLVPDKKQSVQAWRGTIKTINELSKSDAGISSIVVALREGIKHLSLPPQLGQFFKDDGGVDITNTVQLGAALAYASSNNKTMRGGDVFLRLDGVNSSSFTEATHDVGNSLSVFQNISDSPDPQKFFLAAHSIENIVSSLVEVAKLNPDLFSLDMRDVPEWKEHGRITVVNNPLQNTITDELSKRLLDGTAHILGYATTKHHHEPWTVVPRSDVDNTTATWLSDNSRVLSGLQHEQSKKRKRVDHSDSSYRGHDYI